MGRIADALLGGPRRDVTVIHPEPPVIVHPPEPVVLEPNEPVIDPGRGR